MSELKAVFSRRHFRPGPLSGHWSGPGPVVPIADNPSSRHHHPHMTGLVRYLSQGTHLFAAASLGASPPA